MRISCLAVVTLALTSTSLAAPLKRNFFGAIEGVVGAVAQSIENPQLTAARATVIKGLIETQTSLSRIASTASATGNTGVTNLVATGEAGVTSARQAVDSIGKALLSGTKPSTNDQRTVAIGIKDVRNAVNQMAAAITVPDPTLSSEIAIGQTSVQTLQNGGQGVLSASGLTFADLGLPDNFATS